MNLQERMQKQVFEKNIFNERKPSKYPSVLHPQHNNQYHNEDASSHIVIIGSFRKHFQEIVKLRRELERLQIKILSPKDCSIVNPDDEFVIFQSDPTTDQKFLQDAVFAKIRHSTFVLLANFNDYIGQAATLEIGYAIAHGISILTIKPVNDIHLKPYCRLLTDVFPALSYLVPRDTE